MDGQGRHPGLSLHEAGRLIRTVARSHPDIAVTPHARSQMEARQIWLEDVFGVLRGCAVVGMDMRGDAWRYQAIGRTIDGETIGVVVELEEGESLRVITAWRVEARR